MGRSQKWPDLRSPISKIRDKRFVGTGDLIIFRKFQNFPWNIVAVARLESYFVVGSLDLTWWPDLTWHWVEIFTKVAEKMGGKVGENPAALRAAVFFRYPRKTWGGRSNAPPPPAGRGLMCKTNSSFCFWVLEEVPEAVRLKYLHCVLSFSNGWCTVDSRFTSRSQNGSNDVSWRLCSSFLSITFNGIQNYT